MTKGRIELVNQVGPLSQLRMSCCRSSGSAEAPLTLYCYTITAVWYTLHGHQPADVADRRERQPWYTTKAAPALSDMAAELRRVIIAARFSPNHLTAPTEAEIRDVQQAWAQAGLDLSA